ncbi:hypothetical protein [Streptomyces katsurahamanus]
MRTSRKIPACQDEPVNRLPLTTHRIKDTSCALTSAKSQVVNVESLN